MDRLLLRPKLGPEARSNYALRETLLAEKRSSPGGPTAVSTCGANPGMVWWFVKQALLDIARDTNPAHNEPKSREGWGRLAREARRQGHPHRRARHPARQAPKPMDVFVNTWSVEGFVSEGMQPAELGWGTHEKWMPDDATHARRGLRGRDLPAAARRQHARAFLDPDAAAPIRLPRHPQQSISIADYFTVRDGQQGGYRPTCHYAYHPCNDAVLSLHEMLAAAVRCRRATTSSTRTRSWTGSTSSACALRPRQECLLVRLAALDRGDAPVAPYQNATGMQVSSAVLAGMVWALENPKAGIVEADEMDFRRCLEIQCPISAR